MQRAQGGDDRPHATTTPAAEERVQGAAGRTSFKASHIERRLLPSSQPMYAGLPRRQEWDHYPEMEPRRVLQVLDRLQSAGEIRRARTASGRPSRKRDYVWPREVQS